MLAGGPPVQTPVEVSPNLLSPLLVEPSLQPKLLETTEETKIAAEFASTKEEYEERATTNFVIRAKLMGWEGGEVPKDVLDRARQVLDECSSDQSKSLIFIASGFRTKSKVQRGAKKFSEATKLNQLADALDLAILVGLPHEGIPAISGSSVDIANHLLFSDNIPDPGEYLNQRGVVEKSLAEKYYLAAGNFYNMLLKQGRSKNYPAEKLAEYQAKFDRFKTLYEHSTGPMPRVNPLNPENNLGFKFKLDRGKVVVLNQLTYGAKHPSSVRGVVISGASKSSKKEMPLDPNNHKLLRSGNRHYSLAGFGELIRAGEDVVGAAIYGEECRIQALLVSADGTSQGAPGNSAEDANYAVQRALENGKQIAQNPTISKGQIEEALRLDLQKTHEAIQKRYIGITEQDQKGAATAIVAAISREPTSTDNKDNKDVYLHYAYVGDPNLVLLYTKTDGSVGIYRPIPPADQLDVVMRSKGFNVEKMALSDVSRERELIIQEFTQKLGDRQKAIDFLTLTGIHSALGYSQQIDIRSGRINLSAEPKFRGVTKLWVSTASDNAGEKMSDDQLIWAYQQSQNPVLVAGQIAKLAENYNLDDHNLASANVLL